MRYYILYFLLFNLIDCIFGTRSRMPSAHKQILNPSKSYLKLISIRNALCKQYDIV